VPTDEIESSDVLSFAAEVVAAFVSNNSLPVAELPSLIQSVHAALSRLATGMIAPEESAAPTPVVPVRKSVTPDYLICLDDGRKFKSLKRHLAGLGMTPEQYRDKWKLPGDYPMVAPNYAAVRSALATKSGLGLRRRKSIAAPKKTNVGKKKVGRPTKSGA
jgi:predicted transcriptional regulator